MMIIYYFGSRFAKWKPKCIGWTVNVFFVLTFVTTSVSPQSSVQQIKRVQQWIRCCFIVKCWVRQSIGQQQYTAVTATSHILSWSKTNCAGFMRRGLFSLCVVSISQCMPWLGSTLTSFFLSSLPEVIKASNVMLKPYALGYCICRSH